MLSTRACLAAERSSSLLTSQAVRRSYTTASSCYRSSASVLLGPRSSRTTAVCTRNVASVWNRSYNSYRTYASASTPNRSGRSSGPQIPNYTLQELDSMTAQELRALLKDIGLKTVGRKKELVKRLHNYSSHHHSTVESESAVVLEVEQAATHGGESLSGVKSGSGDAAAIAKEQQLQQRLKEAQILEQQEKEARLKEQQEKEAQLKKQQEKERQIKEQQEKERQLKEQQEKERQLKEQQEKERQLKEQQEKERRLKEQQEKERQLKEQQEKERQLKEQQEKERQLKEQQEKERQLKEQQEKERQLKEQQEKERQLKEQQEKERQLKEQQEKEQKERQLKEQQEKERRLKEQHEKERQLKEQQEKERQLKEQQEKERQLKEQQEKERQLKEQQEREQKLTESRLKEQQESREAALKNVSTATSTNSSEERGGKKTDGESSGNDQWSNEKIPLGTKVSATALGIGVVAWFLSGKRDRRIKSHGQPALETPNEDEKTVEA
ncbi:hypothetical protein BGX21_003633 [Mortierella sp. AD011]|nr:hypothetical protein BGX21_003633 [Mortierella sp. AD011]